MPFRKGDKNINRRGAPKKEWTMSQLIREALEESRVVFGGKREMTKKLLVQRLLDKALIEGDMVAIKEINNRLDGLPVQPIDQNVTGKLVIEEVKYNDEDSDST